MTRGRGLAASALAAVLTGCGGSPMTLDGVTILRHGVMTGGPTALLAGTVHFREGCVWADASGETQVVIWPTSSRLDHRDGRLVLVVDDVVIEDGDPFSIGGGQYKDIAFVRELAGSIPDPCVADLYWLGTDINP